MRPGTGPERKKLLCYTLMLPLLASNSRTTQMLKKEKGFGRRKDIEIQRQYERNCDGELEERTGAHQERSSLDQELDTAWEGELGPQGKQHVTGSHKDGGNGRSGHDRGRSWTHGRKQRNS